MEPKDPVPPVMRIVLPGRATELVLLGIEVCHQVAGDKVSTQLAALGGKGELRRACERRPDNPASPALRSVGDRAHFSELCSRESGCVSQLLEAALSESGPMREVAVLVSAEKRSRRVGNTRG